MGEPLNHYIKTTISSKWYYRRGEGMWTIAEGRGGEIMSIPSLGSKVELSSMKW